MKANFGLQMDKKWKVDNSPLTQTDLDINDLVIEAVRKEFPGGSVLAEEKSYPGRPDIVWVCDPIDGTIPFSHGYPLFTFSLALVVNGVPVLGVIYDPMMDRMVSATQGGGALLNGSPIAVSAAESFSRTIVEVESNDKKLERLRRYLKNSGSTVTTFACVTYAAMLVALGELSALVWLGSSPWDAAAAQVIIEEAGGVCSSVGGEYGQRYDRKINGLVAGNHQLHSMLMHELDNSYYG